MLKTSTAPESPSPASVFGSLPSCSGTYVSAAVDTASEEPESLAARYARVGKLLAHKRREKNRNRLVWLTILAFMGGIGAGIYSTFNDWDMVPHVVETTITVQDNWLVGETKDCIAVPPGIKPSSSVQSWIDRTRAMKIEDRSAVVAKLTPQGRQYVYILLINQVKARTPGFLHCDGGTEHRLPAVLFGNIRKLATHWVTTGNARVKTINSDAMRLGLENSL